jgi:hypothetical protein
MGDERQPQVLYPCLRDQQVEQGFLYYRRANENTSEKKKREMKGRVGKRHGSQSGGEAKKGRGFRRLEKNCQTCSTARKKESEKRSQLYVAIKPTRGVTAMRPNCCDSVIVGQQR